MSRGARTVVRWNEFDPIAFFIQGVDSRRAEAWGSLLTALEA